MRLLFTSLIFLFALWNTANAQINYSGKIETGYLSYRYKTIIYEPGPNWKGYYLNEKQNGINLTVINGLSFVDKKLFAGIGLGYLNFEGIHGISVLADFEYLPFKTKLTPLLNLKFGYDHIWNQYEGGTGSMHTEWSGGLNYKLTDKFGLYLKSGVLFTQQSLLVPITMGLRFY